MPDVREIMLLMPGEAGRFRWGRLLTRVKMTVRRLVVATAGTPLNHLYRFIYRAHVWFAVRVARRFSGTRAVYVARSLAKGEIAVGVSDVDMVIAGDWPEPEQIRLMRALGTLAAFSPLYDSGLWQQVHHIESLRNLWETDYFFQSRFDEGRRHWKLMYGSDVIRDLPPVPQERHGGGYYMEARSWWLHFIASAFGSGPTAQDSVFRNSIAYKAVTEVASLARAAGTGFMEESREESLNTTIDEAHGAERSYLEKLRESAQSHHLRFRGDVQEGAVEFLIRHLDRLHADLLTAPSFERIGTFEVDAQPDEVLRAPASLDHAKRLIAHLKQEWPSYRAAYLAPCAGCFALDDLLLLIEVDPGNLPPLAQLRAVCELHSAGRSALTQRIALYLLLPGGACQLEFVNFTEMWRVLVFPPSNPDLFELLARPQFQLDGRNPIHPGVPVWSRFARDVAVEELNVRRSVLSRVTPDVFPSPIEIIRNVYRHLQLEVLVRSAGTGIAAFALSPAAVDRHLRSMDLADEAVLGPLNNAYLRELAGEKSDVRSLVPDIVSYLKRFS